MTKTNNALAQNRSCRRKLSSMTDDELVSLYISGNNNAFDTILKRYESSVYAYILKVVGNSRVAEDVFQDIFIKIVVRIRNGCYTEQGKFASWLMRTVHNHIIDGFRTLPKQRFVSNDDEEHSHLNDHNFAISENREKEMIDSQTVQELKAMIEMLPESQREVVMMRFFDDMSFKEIAEKSQCGINTALGRMHYAIRNLRRLADKYGIDAAS